MRFGSSIIWYTAPILASLLLVLGAAPDALADDAPPAEPPAKTEKPTETPSADDSPPTQTSPKEAPPKEAPPKEPPPTAAPPAAKAEPAAPEPPKTEEEKRSVERGFAPKRSREKAKEDQARKRASKTKTPPKPPVEPKPAVEPRPPVEPKPAVESKPPAEPKTEPALEPDLPPEDATGKPNLRPFKRINRSSLIDVHWDEGLWLLADPKRFTMRLNLRMDIDFAGVDDDAYANSGGRIGNTESGGNMRRARITLRGVLGKHGLYKTSIETTDQAGSLRDNYYEWSGWNDRFGGAGPRIRIGNFFEPFSLEQTTPSARTTFMERSAAVQSFGIGRGLGVMIYDELRNRRAGYHLGAFLSPAAGIGDFAERVNEDTIVTGGVGVTGRLWWLPARDGRGERNRWLVGAALSQRFETDGIQFRARPESFHIEHVIDTDFSRDGVGTPLLDDASSATVVAVDSVWIRGGWSLQGEYFLTKVSSRAAGDPTFHGGYAYVSYFLTGEHRRLADGQIQATTICNPLDPCDDKEGFGALELAARYSYSNLNGGRVHGGSLQVLSLELNWYLADRRRLMFNFLRAQTEDGLVDEPIYMFQARMQLDF